MYSRPHCEPNNSDPSSNKVTRSFAIVFTGKENYIGIPKEALIFNLCHNCVDFQLYSVV
jgi:hypothetical protein